MLTTILSLTFVCDAIRYGREEMLALFDKNIKHPEILPRYKNLFVEKMQCPLALTPSAEDDQVVSVAVILCGKPLDWSFYYLVITIGGANVAHAKFPWTVGERRPGWHHGPRTRTRPRRVSLSEWWFLAALSFPGRGWRSNVRGQGKEHT